MKTSMLSAKQKKNLIRIIVALAAFAAVFIADKVVSLGGVFEGKAAWVFPFLLYLAIYLVIGYDVLWRALRNIAHGQVFDENFLMCIATLGAFALAIYRGVSGMDTEGFDEACAVLLFYQVGEFFQDYAAGRSRRSISALMDIRPDHANILRGGEVVCVDPAEAVKGDIIRINPGEKVPLDGVIIKGASTLDTRALTGESLPREVKEGDEIVSGSVNVTSQIDVRVEREFYDSTVSKILELVENASSQKAKAENFISKFAKYYTPTVVIVAVLLAIVPGAVTGEWSTWIYRALSFLVVSCPCALVISIPLSFFAGIGAASRYGILIKGSNYLEKLNKAGVFVFDKTGTLTRGDFVVSAVEPEADRERVLRLAAIAERDSAHPIARSIAACYDGSIEEGFSLTNFAGEGVVAEKEGVRIACGNEKLMKREGVQVTVKEEAGTVVYVAENGVYVGRMVIGDRIKPEAEEVVGALTGMGCKTVMLTGDNQSVAASVAGKLGIDEYKASLLPQNKVAEVEKLLDRKEKGRALCFVGDGINDAPVLMRSDIGIAMGGVGSDAAIEAADIVLMHDDLKGLPLSMRIARKTMRIVGENIIFSLVIKVAILILSALGITNMWVAVFGDVGVAVLAILNAMRVNGNYEKKPPRAPKK